MKAMVEAVRKSKAELEASIHSRLQEFTKATGLVVSAVDVETYPVRYIGGEPVDVYYSVRVEVRV